MIDREKLLQQYEALNTAIYSGALKVKYADREVGYRSLDEMIRIRDDLKKTLGLTKGIRFIEMEFDSGLK